jgi:hypothetical protein
VFEVTDMIFGQSKLHDELIDFNNLDQVAGALRLLNSVVPLAAEFRTIVDMKSGKRTSRAAMIVQAVRGLTLYQAGAYRGAVQELESCFPVAVDCKAPLLVLALCLVTAQTEAGSGGEMPWSFPISTLLPDPKRDDKWWFRYFCHVQCAKACLALARTDGRVMYDKAAAHIYTGTGGLRVFCRVSVVEWVDGCVVRECAYGRATYGLIVSARVRVLCQGRCAACFRTLRIHGCAGGWREMIHLHGWDVCKWVRLPVICIDRSRRRTNNER